jgi:hypothetical protein
MENESAGNVGDEVYFSLRVVDMNGKSSALGPHLGLAGRVCWPADSSGLIYTGMPGLNERWQIFHNSYPDGVMSRITNDLDSCGSVQRPISTRRRNLIDCLYRRWQSVRIARPPRPRKCC